MKQDLEKNEKFLHMCMDKFEEITNDLCELRYLIEIHMESNEDKNIYEYYNFINDVCEFITGGAE